MYVSGENNIMMAS